nr:hypothetical protein [Hyphomonas sp. Mor2]
MKNNEALNIIIACLLLVGIVAIVIVGWKFTSTEFVLGVAGIGSTIAVASYQYRRAKEREVSGRLFESKSAIYEGIADLVKDLILSDRDQERALSEKEMTRRLMTYRAKMIVWSSYETIEAYDRLSQSPPPSTVDMFVAMAQLYECMRKDLGHSDEPGVGMNIMLGNITDANSFEELKQKLEER